MAPVEESDEESSERQEDENESRRDEADRKEGDEESEEQPEVGPDGWMDLMDGKIRKRTVKEGKGVHPELKQDVRVSVEIRAADPLAESGEGTDLLMHWPDVRYRIGEGEAVPVLELCVRHMKEGEEAELFGTATMAWGPSGLKAAHPCEKEIPPGTDVRLRVKLLEVIDRGEPTWNDLIQEVAWRKANGNDYYKRKEFQRALRSYSAGVSLFTDTGMEPPDYIDEADRERVRAAALTIVADCGGNLAAAHLELGNAVAARAAAEAALDIRPEHIKCLYRLAKAALLLDDFVVCAESLQKGLALDGDNAALLQVQAELKHKQARYEARSKRVAGKVFKDLDYPDLVAEKEERRRLEEEEDRWTVWAKRAFFEWFDKKVVGILAICAALFAMSLFFLPKHHWPMTMVIFVTLTPIILGVYAGATEETKKEATDSKKGKTKQS